jgi:carboxy-terminal domain RNA polymerase II polypeptide A small phosphatase
MPESAMQTEKDKEKDELVPGEARGTEESETMHETTSGSVIHGEKNLKGSRAASGGSEHHRHHRPTRDGQAAESMTTNKLRQRKPKKGIIQSLISAILPCIFSSKAFDLDDSTIPVVKAVKDPNSNSSNSIAKSKSSSVELTKAGIQKTEEKPVSLDKSDPLPSSLQPNKIDIIPQLEPTNATLTVPGLIPVLPPELTSPPTPSETTIIVPPTPVTHLLPDDETWGMTSGAVQAPGSTGEESRQISHISTSTDVEAESIMDDSADDSDPSQSADSSISASPIHEEEDEEARLIRQGGSGIPIGPVSHRDPSQVVYRGDSCSGFSYF